VKFSDAQVSAVLQGRRSIKKINFPPLGCVVGIRILTEAECDAAKLEAARYCGVCKVDLDIDPEFYDREIRRQIVWRAVFDADSPAETPEPFFPSDKDVRSLDTGIVSMLFDAYAEVLEEVVPQRTLDEKGVGALLEALKKGDEPMEVLKFFAPDTLRLCVRSLASMLPAT
jgi:hypothetical protein